MRAVPAFGQILGLTLALILPQPGRAWEWLKPEPEDPTRYVAPRAGDEGGSGAGQCIAAILDAEQRYGIPDHLLLALGLQEAGWQSPEGLTVWPWSVNAAGEGRRFSSRAEALAFVTRKQAEGVDSIDVGCLQINLRWHPEAFTSPAQGFDAGVNTDYAARFLRLLFEESGDWQTAAGRYHSRSSAPQAVYMAGLQRNQQVVARRLTQLTALAYGGGSDDFAEDWYAPAAPAYRTEGAIWGAGIAGEEGAHRTLYSAEDLQPVLPDFLPPEA